MPTTIVDKRQRLVILELPATGAACAFAPIHKEVSRFFVKSGLFALLSVVVVTAFNLAVNWLARDYKDGAAIVCEAKRKAIRCGCVVPESGRTAILFMGDSRTLAGIIPKQFDEQLGSATLSWNLALPALPLGPAYFELKDYLKHSQPPRFVVLNLNLDYGDAPGIFDRYANQGIDFPGEVVSYAISRSDKTVVRNFCLPWLMYEDSVLEAFHDRTLARERFVRRQNANRHIVHEMLKDRGYYFIGEQSRLGGSVLPPVNRTAEPDVNLDRDPYVERFFTLANRLHIRVLLMEPPIRVGARALRERAPEYYTELLRRYGNVRVASDGWEYKQYADEFFSDPVHLNRRGAERFTREMASEFVSVFGDHP